MKHFSNKVGAYIVVVGPTYLFLTICNWTYKPMDWNGFRRVLLALGVIAPIKLFID